MKKISRKSILSLTVLTLITIIAFLMGLLKFYQAVFVISYTIVGTILVNIAINMQTKKHRDKDQNKYL